MTKIIAHKISQSLVGQHTYKIMEDRSEQMLSHKDMFEVKADSYNEAITKAVVRSGWRGIRLCGYPSQPKRGDEKPHQCQNDWNARDVRRQQQGGAGGGKR